jgi:hypothetical protein
VFALVLANALACDREADSQASIDSAKSPEEVAVPEAPASSTPLASAPETLPELYVDGLFRSAGGRVVVLLPRELSHDGTVEFDEVGGSRRLVGKGEDGAYSLFLTMLPPGSYDSDDAAKRFRDEVAASIRTTVDLATLPLRTTDQVGPAGHVRGFRYGPSPSGATATISLIADGRDAALLLVMGREQPADVVVAAIQTNIRVGSKVAKLVDRKPSQRLEGIYATKPVAEDGSLEASWISFDPRGYAHRFAPSDAATLDMAAMVQSAALGQWRAYTYEVQAGMLELTPLRPGDSALRWPLQGSGRTLEINQTEYHRVDGLIADGTTFEGTWEYYNGGSIGTVGGDFMASSTTKRFVFGPGDQVSFHGGTSIVGSTTNSAGLLDSTTAGYVDSGTWKGRYRVEGEQLIIVTSDGVEARRPLAAVMGSGGPSKTSITIAGRIYNKR